MEEIVQRVLMIGTAGVIALHFPQLISWYRLLKADHDDTGDPRLPATHTFLRKLLRTVFFFCIILLGHSLYDGVPSAVFIYPLVITQLAGLIIGERDLLSELSVNRRLVLFVQFLIVMNVLSIVILAAIVLQIHGTIPVQLL